MDWASRYDRYDQIRRDFEAWRAAHGGHSYRDDRRNNGSTMSDLSKSLRDMEYVNLPTDSFVAMCRGKIDGYGTLSAEVGVDGAAEFAAMINTPFEFNKQAEAKQYINAKFMREMEQIAAGKAHIDKLARDAKSLGLGSRMLRQGNARGQYHGSTLDVVTQWVSGGSLSISGSGSSADGSEVRAPFAPTRQAR